MRNFAVPESFTRDNRPLRSFSHIRVGGKSDLLFAPRSLEELQRLLPFLDGAGIPVIHVGGGSNILFPEHCSAAVIVDRNLPRTCEVNGNDLTVSANYNITRLVMQMSSLNLGGLEFVSGLPAHLSGLTVMNAGAFDRCFSEFLLRVEVVRPDGVVQWLPVDELQYQYRGSSIPGFIHRVMLRLQRRPRQEILADVHAKVTRRATNQPLQCPNLGCFFKNPEGHSAGRLIDRCGLKGTAIGGAMVSEKHANFIVNKGNATAGDVRALIRKVRDTVFEQTGIQLTLEIKLVECDV